MALAYRLHKTGVLSEWIYRSMCIELTTIGLGLRSLNHFRGKPIRCFRRFSAFLGILGAPSLESQKELSVSVDELILILLSMAPVTISGDYGLRLLPSRSESQISA